MDTGYGHCSHRRSTEGVLKAVYGRRAERAQKTTQLAKGSAVPDLTNYRDIKGRALG